MKTIPGAIFATFLCFPGIVVSDEDRLSVIKTNLAEILTGVEGYPFSAELVASGLSADDAETISRQAVAGLVSCFVDTAIEMSGERRIPINDILGALEAAIDDAEKLESIASIDRKSIEERAKPCAYGVAQDYGLQVF